MADVSVKKVKELMAKKEAIEKEIKEFQDVLNSVSYYEKNGMIFVTCRFTCQSKSKDFIFFNFCSKKMLGCTRS